LALDGRGALVRTAAASNLGQMLVTVCAEEGISLVNIARTERQVEML
jgi:NADPH:quinone reductase